MEIFLVLSLGSRSVQDIVRNFHDRSTTCKILVDYYVDKVFIKISSVLRKIFLISDDFYNYDYFIKT